MTKYLVTGSTGFVGSRLLGLLNTIECDVELLARSKVNNYETVTCNLGQDRIPKYALESIDTYTKCSRTYLFTVYHVRLLS